MMSLSSPMIRSAPRLFLRSSNPLIRPLRPRRQFSLAPPSQRSRSWRNVTIRWGLAICGIYYYNTSNVFAEEPIPTTSTLSSPSDITSTETLESIAAARHPSKDAPSKSSIPSSNPPETPSDSSSEETPSSLDETAEEASQEGAFNEETGEINWDCPCLGGMAHGPCGEEFRASFSCFVFSKEEPKGMDCIEHFKNMQDCFRQHPDIYGSEMDDDDGDAEPPSSEIVDDSSTSSPPSTSNKSASPNDQVDQQSETLPPSPKPASSRPQVDEVSQQQSQPPSDSPQPPSSELQTAPPHEPVREDEPTAPGRKNIDEKSTLSAPLSS